MPDIVEKTDHVEEALTRLLEQYKDNTDNLQGILASINLQVQDLETVAVSLCVGRALATAEGEQLDLLGTIVDEPRNGLDDDSYRLRLYIKIGQNTSQGEPDAVINVFKLIVGTPFVQYINLQSAGVQLEVPDYITPFVIQFVYDNIEAVLGAGIRLDHLVCYSPDGDAFAYGGGVFGEDFYVPDNPNVPALGYDDGTATIGGKYAIGHINTTPYAYDGTDPDAAGYGAGHDDPLIGGIYVP